MGGNSDAGMSATVSVFEKAGHYLLAARNAPWWYWALAGLVVVCILVVNGSRRMRMS